MSKDFKVKNGLQVTTNITASGNISSSGTITAFVSMSAAAFSGDGSGLTNVLPGGVVSSSGAGTSQGQFKLNDINYSNIISAVGAAQATAHTIKYKYVRDTDVDDTPNMTVSNDVYIDTLTNDPYIGAHGESATVKSVIWTMGIPSVKTIDISLSRTYKYINSTNKFIPGNRIIGKIKDIRKINKTDDKSIVLSRTNAGISGSENKAIDSGGEYVYTTAEFGVATSNYYNNAY